MRENQKKLPRLSESQVRDIWNLRRSLPGGSLKFVDNQGQRKTYKLHPTQMYEVSISGTAAAMPFLESQSPLKYYPLGGVHPQNPRCRIVNIYEQKTHADRQTYLIDLLVEQDYWILAYQLGYLTDSSIIDKAWFAGGKYAPKAVYSFKNKTGTSPEVNYVVWDELGWEGNSHVKSKRQIVSEYGTVMYNPELVVRRSGISF